jgi:SulP family sulfate permease
MKSTNSQNKERYRLLPDPECGTDATGSSTKKGYSTLQYGTSPKRSAALHFEDDHSDSDFVPLHERGWSFQEGRRFLMANGNLPTSGQHVTQHIVPTTSASSTDTKPTGKSLSFYLSCVIYALVNVIISAPGLYGYAAVIFNHSIFSNHMNALSKLVIFSSLVHQFGFFLFSSLPFAIGTVQDAGLIFLSSMANTIANQMLNDGHTEQEIVSTTLVLLSVGTAALGVILVLMGHFRLADAVSYLPMPVVGGYLAFIGFFCIQAGLALCISKSITTLGEWKFLLEPGKFLLAIPGLLAGLLLTLVSRRATNSAVLPLVMVGIPALFYLLIWQSGSSLDDARQQGWVGPIAPSVPVGDLLALVDFRMVRWDLLAKIWPTWVGMVFVVSFASCLDVAAISIDMGEALDTNRELRTVGICNCESCNE